MLSIILAIATTIIGLFIFGLGISDDDFQSIFIGAVAITFGILGILVCVLQEI